MVQPSSFLDLRNFKDFSETLMMAFNRLKISLKYKLLFFLTVIPVLGLLFYVVFAATMFRRDKEAYVYGSTITLSKAIAAQINTEITAQLESLLPLVAQYDPVVGSFRAEAQSIFDKNQKLAFISFSRIAQNQVIEEKAFLEKHGLKEEIFNSHERQKILNQVAQTGFAFQRVSPRSSFVAIAFSEGSSPEKNLIFFISRSDQISKALSDSNLVASYLVSGSGHIQFRPQSNDLLDPSVSEMSFFTEPHWAEFAEGSAEYVHKEVALLASYARLGKGDLRVISLVNKGKALAGVKNLIKKSVYILICIFAVTSILSLFASTGLTIPLIQLYKATQEIAKGNFNIQLQVTSSDEVGGLTDSFNYMTKEVSRLLLESVEKARMAGELETARTVQETLFPEPHGKFGHVELYGFYQPASECGGDWWYYCEIGKYLFIWIGDATGHGAAAALITSAARSAAAVIENFTNITPAQVLTLVNNSIYSTSKGRMMMTFFLAAIDTDTGAMAYCNASHEAPFLLPAKRPLDKSDLVILDDTNGPRLGQQLHATYIEATTQLKDGDMLLLYTDGIPELKDPEGKSWGERRYLKAVLEAVQDKNLTTFYETLKSKMNSYRKDSPLQDDITFVIVKFQKTASQNIAA